MAVVFQFHKLNQQPLHLSYIIFAILATTMFPSPSKTSEYSGKQCYDFGIMSDNPGHGNMDVMANIWLDELGGPPNKTTMKPALTTRYVKILF